MLPASKLEGLLSAFDHTCSLYALCTPDGRVRIFDTVTGRLRSTLESGVGSLASKTVTGVFNGHLAEGHTCLTWLNSKEKFRKSSQGSARTLLAIGTSSGAVKCYDSATGEAQWQATECNEGGVSCLAHSSSQSGLLLSSGADGQVCSINTATGSKQGQFKGSKHTLTAAALSPDGGKLVIGGSTLSLWDVRTQQRLAKYTGHPLPVRELTFCPSGDFALSAAEGERLVAVWPTAVTDKKKRKGSGAAAASLAVEQPVVGLTTAAADGSGAGCFYVAATTSAGEVYCWLIRPQGDSAVSSTQLARLCVGAGKAAASSSSSSSSDCILAAALEAAEQGVSLLLAVGSSAAPHFQRVPINSTAGDSSITYLQPTAASGSITTADGPTAGKAAAVQQMEVDVLGAENGGVAVQQRLSGSTSSRKRQEPEPDGAAVDVEAEAAANEEDEEDEELLESGEQTLGQRVAELEQQHQAVVAGYDVEPEAAAAAAGPSGSGQLPAGPIKADSLGVLLTQALRSSDRALLEQCLSVADNRVITNTVKRLVPMDAALLLRAAVDRLQSKPARGQQLAAWIQAVLLHHTAYLMAAPGAAPVMSSLYQIIEARLAMQRQLLSLAGRLELLLAQSGASNAGAAAAEGNAEPGFQVVYQESDSEAEVELVDAAGDDSDSEDNESDSQTDEEDEQEMGDEEDSEDSQ